MNHYLALAWRCHPKLVWTIIDAPPSSLMDSISNPKVMTRKGEGVGARSLVHNTLGVEGCVGAPRWGLGISTSKSITHTYLHKPNNKLLVHSWNTFGAWTNHEQTRIHKNHHGPNLGEATTFPFIIFFVVWPQGQHPNVILSWDSSTLSHSFTLSHTPESMKCDSQASFLARHLRKPLPWLRAQG
jgi:hypothetical protein